jgi:hypothetical protein
MIRGSNWFAFDEQQATSTIQALPMRKTNNNVNECRRAPIMNHPANSGHHFAARVEAITGPLVGRLGFSAKRLDGRPVLAVFTKSSATPVAGRDRAIAETARMLYDHFAT